MLFEKSNNLKEEDIKNQYDKGDGKPYLEWLDDIYSNMTEEEKTEVEAIGEMLDKKFGFSDKDNDD